MSDASADKPVGPDDRWDAAINALRRAGSYSHIPIFEAGKAGILDLLIVMGRNASVPYERLRKVTLPVLAIIGDDDETPSGPKGWLCAKRLTAWARGSVVHAAGAETEHYKAVVAGTLACQRFLLVETGSAHMALWASMLAHTQLLVIAPWGESHPIARPPGPLH